LERVPNPGLAYKESEVLNSGEKVNLLQKNGPRRGVVGADSWSGVSSLREAQEATDSLCLLAAILETLGSLVPLFAFHGRLPKETFPTARLI